MAHEGTPNSVSVEDFDTGTPVEVATLTIGSKEFQEILVANERGNIAPDIYTFFTGAVQPAGNKEWMSVFNGAGSGKIVIVRQLFIVSLDVSVEGVPLIWDVTHQITGHSGGTLLTVVKNDSSASNLPATITARIDATIAGGSVLYSFAHGNDRADNRTSSFSEASPQLIGMAKPVLREGEGFSVKQVTASTIGSMGVYLEIGTEDP